MENEEKFISEMLFDEINSECIALKNLVNDFADEIQIVKTEKASEFFLQGCIVAIPNKIDKLVNLRKLYEKYSS